MKKILIILTVLYAIGLNAGDFEKGVKAYENGNIESAISFYNKACDDGNALGCYNLGALYDYEEGAKQDFLKAKTFYAKACDDGDTFACNYLGLLYDGGKGVEQDFLKAKTLFGKACGLGDIQGCLARIFL